VNARFLLPEAIAQITRLVTTHPIVGSCVLIGLFVVILLLLKKIFGRIALDTIIFTTVAWAICLIFAGAALTLMKLKGM
jgi:hypothetical protein